MSPSDASALGRALAAEYAAIFGYGVAGAHLAGDDQITARQAESAHRARRDALLVRLTTSNAAPPPADPAYALPFPVTDRPSALKLATQLEDASARVWHAALAATTGDDRSMAANALVDCAVRATRWRRIAGVMPATLTFPGTAT
jgi:hypothetical protein